MMQTPYLPFAYLGPEAKDGRPKTSNYSNATKSFFFSVYFTVKVADNQILFFNISDFVKKFLKVLISTHRRYRSFLNSVSSYEKL